eukprot:1008825-Pleurochrysis_carterae.AAC.1
MPRLTARPPTLAQACPVLGSRARPRVWGAGPAARSCATATAGRCLRGVPARRPLSSRCGCKRPTPTLRGTRRLRTAPPPLLPRTRARLATLSRAR